MILPQEFPLAIGQDPHARKLLAEFPCVVEQRLNYEPTARVPIAAMNLLESATQESCTGVYENLPHLPKYLPG